MRKNRIRWSCTIRQLFSLTENYMEVEFSKYRVDWEAGSILLYGTMVSDSVSYSIVRSVRSHMPEQDLAFPVYRATGEYCRLPTAPLTPSSTSRHRTFILATIS